MNADCAAPTRTIAASLRTRWWGAVTRAANDKSFTDFYARYIDGREPYPWDAVLPLAGLRLARDTIREPRVGISTIQDSSEFT